MGIWVPHHHSVRPYNDSSDGILKRLHLIHVRLFHFARVRIGQQRYKEAQELYQQAADLGYAHGKFRLGLCYYNHWGLNSERIDRSTGTILRDSIKIDYELAMLWFLKASIQGEKKANYYIGFMYEFGKGVPEDKQQALEWYHRSKYGGYFYADACINRLDNEGYIYTTKG
jgi:TPR repeat protein